MLINKMEDYVSMGVRDKLEKQYLCNNDRFADAFNYYVYKGRQVVDPMVQFVEEQQQAGIFF